jgi:Spy/CpxP family protein refolding chaperone
MKVVISYVATLTAFASIAYASDGGWNGEHSYKHQQHNFNKLANKLGLTAAQKTKAKMIFDANKEIVKPIITNLLAEQRILQKLIHNDTIDEAAIRTQTAKISGIQANLNVNKAKVNEQFRAILTPGQLATLKNILHQKHQKKDDATRTNSSS